MINTDAKTITDAVTSGEWDDFLPALREAVEDRITSTMPAKTPDMARQGQVWVWINNSGWEVRGTGVTWPQSPPPYQQPDICGCGGALMTATAFDRAVAP